MTGSFNRFPGVVERHPGTFDISSNFPGSTRLYAFEGGRLLGAATTDGYVLISEWTVGDDLDAETVRVYHFANQTEAEKWHDGSASPVFGRLRDRVARDRAASEHRRHV